MVSNMPSRIRVQVPEPLAAAQAEINRWFDRFLGLDFEALVGKPSAPWAVWQDDERIYFELDLPGVKSEDVELTVHEGALKISAERKSPPSDRDYRYNGRTYGQLGWSFRLPKQVDTDSIEAKFTDGVLHVTLQKRKEAQPRRVEITTS